MNMGLFFLIFLAVLLMNGSVAFSMLFCSGIYMLAEGLSFMLVAQRLVAGANQFVLLAIPFFILASNIMNYGGVTDRIFNFANKAVGHIPGGLGHANILASVIFAGMSGSAVADCAGLGKIEIKAMKDSGYDEGFAAAITGASSIIGPIIPPSIPCVLYGVAASVSIGQLFLGGAIPGVIMAVCLAVMVTIEAVRNGYPREKWEGFRVLGRTLGKSFLSLLTPVIILFGTFTGIVTPTESAVIAILYSLALAFLYKQMTLRQFKEVLIETVRTTVPTMSILCAAQVFGWIMANEQIPQLVLAFFETFIHSKWAALIVVNIFLLIVGCFMEAGAALIILVPVLLPIMTSFGVDPVHFGIIMVLNLMIGLITPPVGICLYILQSITTLSFSEIVKRIAPYLLSLIIALMIVSFVPATVMWLPTMVFG